MLSTELLPKFEAKNPPLLQHFWWLSHLTAPGVQIQLAPPRSPRFRRFSGESPSAFARKSPDTPQSSKDVRSHQSLLYDPITFPFESVQDMFLLSHRNEPCVSDLQNTPFGNRTAVLCSELHPNRLKQSETIPTKIIRLQFRMAITLGTSVFCFLRSES